MGALRSGSLVLAVLAHACISACDFWATDARNRGQKDTVVTQICFESANVATLIADSPTTTSVLLLLDLGGLGIIRV